MPTPAQTAAAERARLAHELAALRRLPPLTGLLCAGEVVRGWALLLSQSPPAVHAAVVEATGLLMWDWADRVADLRDRAAVAPVTPADAAAVRAFGACVAGLCDRRPGPNREASDAVLDALRAGDAGAYYAVYDPHAATLADERELFDHLRETFRPLSAAVKAMAAVHEPLRSCPMPPDDTPADYTRRSFADAPMPQLVQPPPPLDLEGRSVAVFTITVAMSGTVLIVLAALCGAAALVKMTANFLAS